MKLADTLILGVKLSIFLIIAALIAAPWITKNNTVWVSEKKQATEIQDTKPQQKEKQPAEAKTSKPVYRTFGTVKLKEVYTYPKHGFYVYEFESGDTTELAFFNNMASELKYSNANYLTIFIYDKKIDEAPFWNAPKQVPANLIVEADKQKPWMYFISSKDLIDMSCDRWGLDYFYRNQQTGWQWTPDQEKDISADYCKYFPPF